MILLGSAQIYWHLFHRSNMEQCRSGYQPANESHKKCRRSKYKSTGDHDWSQSTSCRQKKPTLFPTLDVLIGNSRQWDRTCSPDNFVHALCYSSFKLLSQENQNHIIHLKWVIFRILCFSLRSTIPPSLRAELELNVPSIALHARTCTCFIVL